jgi:GntR family transcriptional regulator/MocR family aminotransferase
MVVPRWAAAGLGEAIRSLYRGGQAVEQRALARFLESGQLTRHLRRMGPIYRARQQALRSALHAHFGDACPVLGGQAGCIWCYACRTARPTRRWFGRPGRWAWRLAPERLLRGAGWRQRPGARLRHRRGKRIPELVGRLAQAVLG